MKIRIYQINTDRDTQDQKFTDYNQEKMDESTYDEVFRGIVDCENLEDVFAKFNMEGHPLFRGHSMSVSDVVLVEEDAGNFYGSITFFNTDNAIETCYYKTKEKYDEELKEGSNLGRVMQTKVFDGIPETPKGAYYCQGIGFKQIDFDDSRTILPNDLMRIVYVEPHMEAYESYMDKDLDSLQRAVKGMIEPIYIDSQTDFMLVGNDEAKLIGMEGNRRIGEGGSIIAGPFFICGVGEEDFISINDEQIKEAMEVFGQPEDISMSEVEDDMGFQIIGM